MPSFPGRRPRRKGAFGRCVKPNRSRVILTGQRCAIYDADIQWNNTAKLEGLRWISKIKPDFNFAL